MGANLILPSSSPADDAAVVTKSCRFDGTAAYLSRTFGAGDRKTWTLAAWVKLGSLSPTSATGTILARTEGANDDGGPTIWMDGGPRFAHAFDPSTTDNVRMTKAIYRDPAAWYHVVWWCDTTVVGTSGDDRWKIYVNGVLQELETPSGYNGEPAQDVDMGINDAELHKIGTYASQYFSGLLADVYFVDGSAVVPTIGTNFIQRDGTTGQLKPMEYTVSGTNGFHLDFKDSAELGNDAAGSNNWSENDIDPSDQMNDRPTNNYAVLNPLYEWADSGVFAEGNLSFSTGDAYGRGAATILPSSDRWYGEFYITDYERFSIGVMNEAGANSLQGGADTNSAIIFNDGGTYYGGASGPSYVGQLANANIVSFALDLTNDILWFAVNGVWAQSVDVSAIEAGTATDSFTDFIGSATPVTGGSIAMFVENNSASESMGCIANFGQDATFTGLASPSPTYPDSGGVGAFFYEPPDGFLALSTANLPDPDIKKGHKNFNTLLYDDGTGAKTFGAADNMQPDLVWVKSRGSTNDHKLTDSVRGVQESLESNTVDTEVTESSNVGVTVFGADGFTVGSSSSTTGPYADQTGTGMVGWGWKGGTAGSSGSGVGWAENFNATAGFSIIKWTGNDDSMADSSQTVSHSLGVAPDFIIAKNRTNNASGTGSWIVYHKDLPSGDFLRLDDNNAKFTPETSLISSIGIGTVAFASDAQGLSPTNEYLNFGGEVDVSDADTYIAYLFSEVAAYSKFGEYTGNGDVDGPFTWCSFRPSYVLIRRAGTTGDDWTIYDSARSPYNAVDDIFYANTSGIESPDDTSHAIDFLSNGFKCRGTSAQENSSGAPYIFAAFAEKPFKYAAAR